MQICSRGTIAVDTPAPLFDPTLAVRTVEQIVCFLECVSFVSEFFTGIECGLRLVVMDIRIEKVQMTFLVGSCFSDSLKFIREFLAIVVRSFTCTTVLQERFIPTKCCIEKPSDSKFLFFQLVVWHFSLEVLCLVERKTASG